MPQNMKALIVEDDSFKLDQIQSVVEAGFPNWELGSAMSAHSAKKNLISDAFDLVLLDMSLPSFDINEDESGGRPLNYGGKEIIRFLRRKNLHARALVITQYEEFVEGNDVHNLRSLKEHLSRDYEGTFLGILYFDSGGVWASKLVEYLTAFGSEDESQQ